MLCGKLNATTVLLFLLLRTCSSQGCQAGGRAGEEQCHLSSANQMQTAGCCRARGLINPCVHAETDGYVCMRAGEIHNVHYRVGKDYLCTFVCLVVAATYIHEIHNALAELPLAPRARLRLIHHTAVRRQPQSLIYF
jgi:hypothetical protein